MYNLQPYELLMISIILFLMTYADIILSAGIEQKHRKMTSSSNLTLGSVWADKLFEMMNQEFTAKRTTYQVLPIFGICCRELKGLKVASFRACVHSFCSVVRWRIAPMNHSASQGDKFFLV